MSVIAKLIIDGEEQAVLLPEGFEFNGDEVRINKIGDKVILEPIEAAPDARRSPNGND
jgi:antitoxin VapB